MTCIYFYVIKCIILAAVLEVYGSGFHVTLYNTRLEKYIISNIFVKVIIFVKVSMPVDGVLEVCLSYLSFLSRFTAPV